MEGIMYSAWWLEITSMASVTLRTAHTLFHSSFYIRQCYLTISLDKSSREKKADVALIPAVSGAHGQDPPPIHASPLLPLGRCNIVMHRQQYSCIT